MSKTDSMSMLAIRKVATAIYEAGETARRMRTDIREGERVGKGRPGDFVTMADEAVQRQLYESLLTIVPDAGFLSEEGACKASSGGTRWVVDPIDGTGNYLSDLPYAISVAYQDDDGTVLGMVYEPEVGRLFWAHRGQQAFLVPDLGAIMPCYVDHMVGGGWLGKPIRRMPEADIAVVGMPYDRDRTNDALAMAGQLHSLFGDVKRIGPASLDICRVALGNVAIYAEYDLRPWDYAAAEVIAKEAGCIFEQRGDLTVCGSRHAIMRFDGMDEGNPPADAE